MIDIDVVGQLLPNAFTMLTQLCSTLVLFLVAKKVLGKSIANMLNARADMIQEQLTQSEAAKQEAEEDRLRAKEELKAAVAQSEEIINRATVEAKNEGVRIIAKAKEDAASEIKKAKNQIEQEKKKMEDDMVREMVEIAMSATEKLVGEKSDEETDRKAIDAFVKEAAYGQSSR